MFNLTTITVRRQLILLIAFMTLVPSGFICWFAVSQRAHEVADATGLASTVTRRVENEQKLLLAGAEQFALILSRIPEVKQRKSAEVSALLAEILKTNRKFSSIFITDGSGSLWASALPVKPGLSFADRRYFRQAVASGRMSSGEFSISRIQHVPVISFGSPFKDDSGRITDVLVVTLSLESYAQLFSEIIPNPMSSVVLLDHKGTILFSSATPEFTGRPDKDDLFRKMSLSAEDSGIFKGVGNSGIERLFAYRKLRLPGEVSPYLYIRTGISNEYVYRRMYDDLKVNAAVLLTSTVMAIGLALFYSRRVIIHKVAGLQNATNRIARGDFGIDCGCPASSNELDQLGCALMQMSQQLQSAHEALRKTTENYRELVDNAGSVILKWDAEGRILFFNEYAEKLFGFSAAEVLGRNVIGTIVPETESNGRNLAEMIKNISSDPAAYENNENENICKDGRRVWMSWNNRPLASGEGGRQEILSIGVDVTERKKIESDLRVSEERFRSFVENANDVVFALTADGNFSYVSSRWKDAFGYDISETVGHPFVPFVHPEDVPGCFEFLQKVMTTGEKQSGVEYRVHCKDGRYLWYRANGSLMRDPYSGFLTFIGIGRDISERKRAESELRQSEEKFAAVFRASPDAIMLTRRSDGTYLDVNEGFTRLTGYLPAEAVGRSSEGLGLWEDAAGPAKAMQILAADGLVDNCEVKLKRRDGTRLVCQLSLRIIVVDGVSCFLGLMRDITGLDFMQQELVKAQKLESICVLAGGIAHNFNNVLTGVIGYISYAKKHLNEPSRVLPILESAEKSSYRAAGLARQLLTFSRGSTSVKKAIPVHTLVEESVSLFLTGTNVKEKVTCNTDQAAIVDSQQISQAFNNIILNAVHAMADGGTLNVTVSSERLTGRNKYSLPSGSYVKVVFKDSGCGIPKDDLLRIFDPYFTTKDTGTGLGLSTALSTISRHNGHLGITSEVGKGTAVTVLLPAAEKASEAHAEDAVQQTYNGFGMSLLVMDDEEMIRDLADNQLSELGYEVTTCSDGEAAVSCYEMSMKEGKVYSAVVLDLVVPGGTGGVEAARRIIGLDPEALLIASSGNSEEPAVAQYGDYGFSGSISKPYTVRQLEEAVYTALKSRKG